MTETNDISLDILKDRAAKPDLTRFDSAVSLYEPRPGEKTYAGGKSQADSGRPTIEQLRNPNAQKQGVKGLFEQQDIEEEAGLVEEDAAARDSTLSTMGRKKPVKQPVKFGMWDGVFARCLLNIFGVIMFLRVPWLVAYAGVGMSLVIILVSVGITLLSSLSLSAICTNGEIKGGGAYYLISRSLGPEFGGAIGVMFYFANAVAISMYLIGFGETIVQMAGGVIFDEAWDLRIIALISLVVIQIICLVGVEYVVKVQLGLLGLLVCSLICFIIGCFITHDDLQAFMPFGDAFGATMGASYEYTKSVFPLNCNGTCTEQLTCPLPTNGQGSYTIQETLKILDKDVDFGVALAVFFPAVTGIMAGANISGDLKDASYAIPTGTNAAIAVSTVVYCFLVVLVGAVSARATAGTFAGEECPFGGIYLDYIFMARMSIWPPMVYAGIFASTLSSGIASLVGAPRILQAVAKDKLFPKTQWLEKGMGANDEPIAAYVLTFIIAVGCILIGDLNAIAPLITNFFMCSYALTNFACFMADISRSPGWRPTFRYYNKWASLIGAIVCTGFMLFLNLPMGFASIAVGMLLYAVVAKVAPEVNWGSAAEGYRYIVANRSMKALSSTTKHVKNWRPQLLVLVNHDTITPGKEDPLTVSLMEFAVDMKKAHGVIVAGTIVTPLVTPPAPKAEEAKEGDGTLTSDDRTVSVDTVDGAMQALVSAGDLVEDKANPYAGDQAIRDTITSLANRCRDDSLKKKKISSGDVLFAEVIHAPNFLIGARGLLQAAGLGAMRPNTLVMGFMEDWASQPADKILQYVQTIGTAFDHQYGIVIMRSKGDNYGKTRKNLPLDTRRRTASATDRSSIIDVEDDKREGTMDCWWFSDDGGLTMLLPHLILKSKAWRSSPTQMRLMNPHRGLVGVGKEVSRLQHLVKKFRIGATVSNVLLSNVDKPKEGSFEGVEASITKGGQLGELTVAETKITKERVRIGEIIQARSRKANMCVISVPVPRRAQENQEKHARMYMAWLDSLSKLGENLPVLMVHGNQEDALTFYS